ncbi:MAG: hypothetical protein PVH59_15295, partial [Anaerolineae bacterium]
MESRLRSSELTRRQFVRLAMAAGFGAALTSCAGKGDSAPAAPVRAEASPVGDNAYLAVARGADPGAITRTALAAIG